MYTICKEFAFSASHILDGLPEGHPCGRLHGHNYVVRFVLQAEALDETGFVIDYGKLDVLKQYIDNRLDHRHLNDMLSLQPSAENVARHLFGVADVFFSGQVSAVEVSETPKTWARYEA